MQGEAVRTEIFLSGEESLYRNTKWEAKKMESDVTEWFSMNQESMGTNWDTEKSMLI